MTLKLQVIWFEFCCLFFAGKTNDDFNKNIFALRRVPFDWNSPTYRRPTNQPERGNPRAHKRDIVPLIHAIHGVAPAERSHIRSDSVQIVQRIQQLLNGSRVSVNVRLKYTQCQTHAVEKQQCSFTLRVLRTTIVDICPEKNNRKASPTIDPKF